MSDHKDETAALPGIGPGSEIGALECGDHEIPSAIEMMVAEIDISSPGEA